MVSPIVTYGCESWTIKKAENQRIDGFWIVVLEKTLESPLDSKVIQPVHPKGNESWIFIGRTNAEADTPILWPPDAKNWLFWKDPAAGKDWRQKGMTKDEMIGFHYRLYGHEFEQTLGVSDGQGSLACCSPQRVRYDWVTELNWGNKFKPKIPEMTSRVTPQNRVAERAAAFAVNRNPQDAYCNHALSQHSVPSK